MSLEELATAHDWLARMERHPVRAKKKGWFEWSLERGGPFELVSALPARVFQKLLDGDSPCGQLYSSRELARRNAAVAYITATKAGWVPPVMVY